MSGELGSDLRSEQTSSRAERRPYLENFELDQDSQQGWKNEIKRWKKVHSRNGFFEIYDDKERIEDIRKREREMQGGGYPILVYDEYDTDGNRIRVRLKIDSTPLLDLLRKVITFYPGDDFDILGGKDSPDDSVTFTDPFMIFFDNKTQLEQSLHSDMPEDAKEHARMLLKFIKEEYPFWTFTLAKIQEGRCRKISFSDLWLLFPPNTPVYARKGADIRQIMIYARKSAEYNPQAPLTLTYWEVVCEQGVFKREFNEWTIESFAGEKSINKLDLVPVRYMDNEAELHQKLVARGRRYFELSKAPSLQDYYGTLFPRVYKDEPVRVVVDEDTYWSKHPFTETNEGPSQDYGFAAGQEDLVDYESNPFEDTLLRCFPEVGVYSLRNKDWALVKVEDLQPVRFREKAFKRLVIKDQYKKIIKAMVQAYALEKPGFSDLVAGKGRGLAILLHGPPGTGKTLTAECVAERQQCPLFTMSCGDLGTEPDVLERKLKEVFQYAVTWKAILLLDEADIFLQERDIQDVKRNALVSIFLRELDYFEGVLFLTTNRPGDIDEAFVSRIHVTVGLNSLSQAEQPQIWTIFIRDLDISTDEKSELLKYVTKNFANDNLNGRQIRNTMRTALALAQLKQQNLNAEHLNDVMAMTREYSSYLTKLHKVNGEDLARILRRRATGHADVGEPGRQSDGE